MAGSGGKRFTSLEGCRAAWRYCGTAVAGCSVSTVVLGVVVFGTVTYFVCDALNDKVFNPCSRVAKLVLFTYNPAIVPKDGC